MFRGDFVCQRNKGVDFVAYKDFAVLRQRLLRAKGVFGAA
jgi:hypothetical protein